jgi:uncharacterized protein YdhG (YjbR/CyaY superfamily)
MSPTKSTKKSAKSTTAKPSEGFTAEERAAMRDRVRELKAGGSDGESDVLAKIAEMPEPDRVMAELTPRTWYGMPAYSKDGKVLCYFRSAQKFKTRYATFGFSDKANLDDGGMWPTDYALQKLTAADEKRIVALVKQAVS